jgi:hypothetical protein
MARQINPGPGRHLSTLCRNTAPAVSGKSLAAEAMMSGGLGEPVFLSIWIVPAGKRTARSPRLGPGGGAGCKCDTLQIVAAGGDLKIFLNARSWKVLYCQRTHYCQNHPGRCRGMYLHSAFPLPLSVDKPFDHFLLPSSSSPS